MDNVTNIDEATAAVLTPIGHDVWETKEWPKEWTQSFVIHLPKKDNLKQYQNYPAISLISHPRGIML